MKIKSILTVALLACAVSAFGAATPFALPQAVNVFSATTTNVGVNPSYAVISSRSANGGAPVVTFINAGSDAATGKITTYRVTAALNVLYTNSTTTLFVENTNNSAANWQVGSIVIRHKADDSYEKRTLAANTGATNLVVSVAPMGTTVPGDMVYCVTAGPTIFIGAITNNIGNGSGPIVVGQKGLPLLIEASGTSGATVNCAGGYYAN